MKNLRKKVNHITSHIFTYPLTFWLTGLLALAVVTLHIYLRRTDFNFVDEFYNYLSAYFMQQGKHLYTDIFFNHQPLMAWFSQFVLIVVKPDTLYKYVVLHRLVMIAISLGFMALFLLRLRIIGLLFLVVFEYLKYYFFGFTFQPESIIAYMSAYLFFIVWQLWHKKQVYWFDYVFSTCFVWFSVFSRETLIPLVSFLYLIILTLQPKKDLRVKIISVITFMIVSVSMFAFIDVKQWFYQVFEFNRQTVVSAEIGSQDGPVITLLRAFGYIFYIFFGTTFNHYHVSIQLVVALCLYGLVVYIKSESQKKSMASMVFFIVGIILIGGLAALRPHPPGQEFYGIYRISSWISIMCMLTALLIGYIQEHKPVLYSQRVITVCIFVLGYMYLAPRSYLYQIPSIKSFDNYFVAFSPHEKYGNVVKALAQGEDTFYVDGYNALPYLVSGVKPAYPGIYFFPPQKGIQKYETMRTEMFMKNPPTFYLQDCYSGQGNYNLSKEVLAQYTPLLENIQKPCMYVLKTKISSLTPEQKKEVVRHGFKEIQ